MTIERNLLNLNLRAIFRRSEHIFFFPSKTSWENICYRNASLKCTFKCTKRSEHPDAFAKQTELTIQLTPQYSLIEKSVLNCLPFVVL